MNPIGRRTVRTRDETDGGARRIRRRGWTAAAGLLALTGWLAVPGGGSAAAAQEGYEPAPLYSMGVPTNAVPDPGKCRIWRPRNPPARQKGSGACERLARRVPEGAWLLRSLSDRALDRQLVEVIVYGDRGGRFFVRLYDADTGEFIDELMRRDALAQTSWTGITSSEEPATGGPARDPAVDEAPVDPREGGAGAEEEGGAPPSVEEATSPEETGGDRQADAPSGLFAMGVPPAALPSPGRCRIWQPGAPALDQRASGACRQLERQVRAGEWLLRRPEGDDGGDRVLLEVYGEDGEPALVLTYDAGTGRFLGTGKPGSSGGTEEGGGV